MTNLIHKYDDTKGRAAKNQRTLGRSARDMEVLTGWRSTSYSGKLATRYYSLGRSGFYRQQAVTCQICVKDTDTEGSLKVTREELARLQGSSRVPQAREEALGDAPPPVLQVLRDETISWDKENAARIKDMGSSDTSLSSTMEHRLWVFAGCSSLLGMLAKSAAGIETSSDAGLSALAILSAYVLADLATGIYHWGIDNYGDDKTPLFGPQIDAFQGHHKRPWTITKRDFSNNIHSLARPATIFLVPVLVATPGSGPVDAFLGVFLGCVVFSQQFHSWAHTRRSQLPGAVRALQDLGVLVSTRMHGKHHREPFDGNYCIVSGIWNRVLDSSGVLRLAERWIYSNWGYAPRCWSDSSPEWSQQGSYFED
ncbi:fatty acid desaturase 4-like 2, chloroplastic [Selaginella moellendorffii]|nr:fatty acid desaturase 4-like 2, chloroplastic [Selaginella moellendorffii]|eukprot:XP_002965032.2 fatty acid desaturase 4-like 2, chloroplastic [Selaginella moellendorffii]